MTLPEANGYFSQWSESPPTHVLVKALLDGLSGSPKKSISDRDIEDLEARSRGSLPVTRGRPDPLDNIVVLDPNALALRNRERAKTIALRNKAKAS